MVQVVDLPTSWVATGLQRVGNHTEYRSEPIRIAHLARSPVYPLPTAHCLAWYYPQPTLPAERCLWPRWQVRHPTADRRER